jgi:hypothetical protein
MAETLDGLCDADQAQLATLLLRVRENLSRPALPAVMAAAAPKPSANRTAAE